MADQACDPETAMPSDHLEVTYAPIALGVEAVLGFGLREEGSLPGTILCPSLDRGQHAFFLPYQS